MPHVLVVDHNANSARYVGADGELSRFDHDCISDRRPVKAFVATLKRNKVL
ncbi:hypothetical protein KCP74_22105 [Salmonella enterica subsp. enterica]|nr:hypothetical protein KCP74_22105 [Salmonella enterica subsp. enterica]